MKQTEGLITEANEGSEEKTRGYSPEMHTDSEGVLPRNTRNTQRDRGIHAA